MAIADMGASAGDGCVNLVEFIASPFLSRFNFNAGAYGHTLLNVYIYTHIQVRLHVYTYMYKRMYIYPLLSISKNVFALIMNWPKIRFTYLYGHMYIRMCPNM